MDRKAKLTLIASGIAKGPIVQAVKQAGEGRVEIRSMSDIQAAQAVRQGLADYFIGSCSTGQGGALSMAIAVLGAEACVMLTERGRMLPAEQIRERVAGDYRAFGISADHVAHVIPLLVAALLEKHEMLA